MNNSAQYNDIGSIILNPTDTQLPGYIAKSNATMVYSWTSTYNSFI